MPILETIFKLEIYTQYHRFNEQYLSNNNHNLKQKYLLETKSSRSIYWKLIGLVDDYLYKKVLRNNETEKETCIVCVNDGKKLHKLAGPHSPIMISLILFSNCKIQD